MWQTHVKEKKKMGMNSGYNGWSMSNRAVEAYEDGQMPLSKWSKKLILSEIERIVDEEEIKANFSMENLNKMNKDELTCHLLSLNSWHHTSIYCNETNFYGIDTSAVEALTNEKIASIIASRMPKEKKPFEEKKPNLFITALVYYDQWEGTRNHPKKVYYEEVVHFRSNDKMVNTRCGNKRISSLTIIKKVEQKTKYAEDKKVERREIGCC